MVAPSLPARAGALTGLVRRAVVLSVLGSLFAGQLVAAEDLAGTTLAESAGVVSLHERPVPLQRRLVLDLHDLALSPKRAHGLAWRKLAFGVGLVGIAYSLDEEVRTELEPHERSSLAREIRPIGQEAGLAFIGLSWLAGHASGNRELAAMGRDGVEATILAAGIVTPALKRITGRERPNQGLGNAELGTSGQSFPSGEVTEAFAIASVVSAHADRKWVKGIAWTLASATAWQRMELDAHWSSDVVAGALIGTAIGQWVVRRNRERVWELAPQVGSREVGVVVSRRF